MDEYQVRRDAPYVRGKTALLLVDIQQVWLEHDASHPADEDSVEYYRTLTKTIVPNAAKLLEAARAGGAEVIHTIIQSMTADGRDRSLDHKLSNMHVAPNDPRALPPPELALRANEILLPKTSSGVFNSTNIDYLLKNLGVQFLVVAGIMTDQCVDMAVRDAADRGYSVTCVADACMAATHARHNNALSAYSGYCWTANTDEVCTRLRGLAA